MMRILRNRGRGKEVWGIIIVVAHLAADAGDLDLEALLQHLHGVVAVLEPPRDVQRPARDRRLGVRAPPVDTAGLQLVGEAEQQAGVVAAAVRDRALRWGGAWRGKQRVSRSR